MNRLIVLISVTTIPMLITGCGPKVLLPPKIDLTRYQSVGVVSFSCNAEGNLGTYTSHRFIDLIRWYQKKVIILEIDLNQETLDSLRPERLNTETIRKIGSRYKLDALFTGHLQVEEVQPLFKTYPGGPRPESGTSNLVGRKIAANVKASLAIRLWDIQSGGTVWMTSRTGEGMVDQATYQAGGKIIFDAREPRYAFWELVDPLVKSVAVDLKPEEVKGKKEPDGQR